MKKTKEKQESDVVSIRLPVAFLKNHVGTHQTGKKTGKKRYVWNSKKLRQIIEDYYKETEPTEEPEMTTHNFKTDEIKSFLQKSIRRADQDETGFCAWELMTSGVRYVEILFNRLFVISFEDVSNPIAPVLVDLTHRKVKSIYNASKPKATDTARIRGDKIMARNQSIMIAIACAMHLARMKHRREADSQTNYLNYFDEKGQFEKIKPEIPDYVLDKHTAEGRKRHKKDKEQNFWNESVKMENVAEDYDRKYEKLMQQIAKKMDEERLEQIEQRKKKKVKKSQQD